MYVLCKTELAAGSGEFDSEVSEKGMCCTIHNTLTRIPPPVDYWRQDGAQSGKCQEDDGGAR